MHVARRPGPVRLHSPTSSTQQVLLSLTAGSDIAGRHHGPHGIHAGPRPARTTCGLAEELLSALSPNGPKRRLLPVTATADGVGAPIVEAGTESTPHRHVRWGRR